MSLADTASAPDPWPQLRQPRVVLRRNRILPGPLRTLDRPGRRPVWAMSAGLVGLSLAATLAVAPQIRGGASAPPPPALVEGALPDREVAEPVRIVGAAPAPQTAPMAGAPTAAVPDSPALPVSSEPRTQAPIAVTAAAPPAKTPAKVPAKPTPAPSVDLGPLPVLELDEAAFDGLAAPRVETAPRPAGRMAVRP
ncbi:MAG: hypothetical protein PGN25_05110 [Methylorubrum populi]